MIGQLLEECDTSLWLVRADLAPDRARGDDRDVVLGGERGRWLSMICLGFEDSSRFAGNVEIYYGSKTVRSLTCDLSLPPYIWLIFWPARIGIVRVKNL